MGRAKQLDIKYMNGSYESDNGIVFNGKVYKNHGSEYEHISYSLEKCPVCGKDMVKETVKDETPGFRDSFSVIVDRKCKCDLDS